jgi:transcriptional regulator with PAS, ATPase and Fis domain
MSTPELGKKRICVLSIEKNSSDFMVEEIRRILGYFVTVQGFCFQDDIEHGGNQACLMDSDMIVTAGETSYQKALSIAPSKKVLIARRTISSANLEELSLLPKGKTVLVVNYSHEATMKTIRSLEELGLTHLRYIPYWKDCDIEVMDIDLAISPGMIHLCPEHVTGRIDIGMRHINYSTLVDICVSLDIGLDALSSLAAKHTKILVDTYKRLNNERQRVEAITLNIHSILNIVECGFMFIDNQYKVSAVNRPLERILGKTEKSLLGRNINSILSEFKVFEGLLEPRLINQDTIIEIKGKSYLGSCKSLMKESGENYVLTIQEFKEKTFLKKRLQSGAAGKGFQAIWHFDDIVGESLVMKDLVQKAKLMAQTDSTILLAGESGTGKELLAHAIHNDSSRKDAPFIAANFAAIPESLIESELFGYEDGAFTGSKKGGNAGLFEQANGGTIFLDEIGDAAQETQKRLLRVLQGKEIMRLGSAKRVSLDVRIIAATNRDLRELIKKGLFREDLYFRLRVCTLKIPPLRERKEDVIRFIHAFFEKYGIRKELLKAAEDLLLNHEWEGNVRELENVIEYIANVSQNSIIGLGDLPEDFRTSIHEGFQPAAGMPPHQDKLFDLYNAEDILLILQTIHQAKRDNVSLGRKKLSEIILGCGINLSESKVRTRLNKMVEEGLVSIGKTKQGILITDKGEAFLQKSRTD